MSNYMDFFPSTYMRAADILEPTQLRIVKVEPETVGEDNRLVVTFAEDVKPLVLNKTNAKSIAKIAGTPDYKKWGDVVVELYTKDIEYRGETFNAIRIREPSKKAPSSIIQKVLDETIKK